MEISDKIFRLTIAICAVLITLFCFVGVILLNQTKVAEQRQACIAWQALPNSAPAAYFSSCRSVFAEWLDDKNEVEKQLGE